MLGIEVETPARKILPIIYVIDTSDSMADDTIDSLNNAMIEAVYLLKGIAERESGFESRIGILTYSTGAEWRTKDPATGMPSLVRMEDFFWSDLEAGGLVDIGEALKELDDKMSRYVLFSEGTGYKMPVIIFFGGAEPTDNWEAALKEINERNKWFRYSTKICVAVGGDANKDALARIAGSDGWANMGAVVEVNDMESLKRLIRVLTITATMIDSCGRLNDDKQDAFMRAVKDEMSGDVGIVMPGQTAQPDPFDPDAAITPPDDNDLDASDALCGWDDLWED